MLRYLGYKSKGRLDLWAAAEPTTERRTRTFPDWEITTFFFFLAYFFLIRRHNCQAPVLPRGPVAVHIKATADVFTSLYPTIFIYPH